MTYLRYAFIAVLFALASFSAQAEPVDVNLATAQELAKALRGVGPAKAAAIIAHREQHGPFQVAEDLAEVSGIGMKLVEANRDNLQINSLPSAE